MVLHVITCHGILKCWQEAYAKMYLFFPIPLTTSIRPRCHSFPLIKIPSPLHRSLVMYPHTHIHVPWLSAFRTMVSSLLLMADMLPTRLSHIVHGHRKCCLYRWLLNVYSGWQGRQSMMLPAAHYLLHYIVQGLEKVKEHCFKATISLQSMVIQRVLEVLRESSTVVYVNCSRSPECNPLTQVAQ